MALKANALLSLADLKLALLDDTTKTDFDNLFEMFIDQLSAVADKLTGRNLAAQTYSNELHDGNDKRRLYLDNYPINSVSALTEDDDSLTEGADEDFIIYGSAGYLRRMDANWSAADFQNIDVSYNAGYVAISVMNFDSGSEEPVIGDTLTSTSGSGVVTAIYLTSGAWGSGTGAGWIEYASITGEFADDEVVAISGGTADVMTVNEPGGNAKDSPGVPDDIKNAMIEQIGKDWKDQKMQGWGESGRTMGDGSVSVTTTDLLTHFQNVMTSYRKMTL